MLKVINLKKSYGSHQVLKGINLTVNTGETVVIMGPSGCGKSTLIRCINRLTEPDSGEIIYKGIPVHQLNEKELLKLRKDIGFVFQNFNLINRLTVLQNVMLGLIKWGLKPKEAEERAIRVLEQVELKNFIHSKPAELSGGQQQRVAIARALALDPDLMLLDEPTASLDPILVGEVLKVMEELTRQKDKSLLIVTHEVAFARRVANRIVLMDQGVIVEEGSPETIFKAPKSWVGRRYKEMIEYQ
ncbi:peptide ABC transporter ATP-binding protein [Anoxybacter fermentans]|uniref:Peptide ABC transporter ATP-binding protein n=1 Tax=Anoxybacter fermentans TaxID=1323375 RepID=A0A3Q9HRR6_9FIRM|nr:amino acid ABC transporter ATP-binding protein [Anoxybacter fermentans]AZR73952.1 peptide ABC transporter ATP-binding protein [Anoxybacter fermentans]